MSGVVLLDGGWTTTRDAEHAARDWACEHRARILLACSHFHAGRVLVTVTAAAAPDLAARAGEPAHAAVLAAHADRTSGRVFVFPGQDDQPALTTVGDLCATSAVDEVVAVGGVRPGPGTALRTLSFLRPELADGLVRLRVRPAAGGCLVPFEQPSPTPCCAVH